MSITVNGIRDVQNGTTYREWTTPGAGYTYYAGYDGTNKNYWVTQIKFTVTEAFSNISVTLSCGDTRYSSSSYPLHWGISSSDTEQAANKATSQAGTYCGTMYFPSTWTAATFSKSGLGLPAGTYYLSIWNGNSNYGDFTHINSHSGYSISMSYTKATTYTVSYDANGGSGAPSSQIKYSGVSLKLSSTIPTRANYTFKGWSTNPSGSVVYAAGGTYTANASATLYAVWESSSSGGEGILVIEENGLVRIYNNSTFDEYQPYIYDGTNQNLAVPYIHDGASWRLIK